MILPDNIKPTYSLYYVGGLILRELGSTAKGADEIFFSIRKTNPTFSYRQMLLGLDWLFLSGCIAEKEGTGLLYVPKAFKN